MCQIYVPSLSLVFVLLGIISCKQSPGPGGMATITGKVFALDYSSSPDTITNMGYIFEDKYYIQDKLVQLRYGDDPGISEVAKTSYSGTYIFENLRPGNYKIIVYSRSIDTLTDKNLSYMIYEVKEVHIDKRKEVVKVDDFVVIQ